MTGPDHLRRAISSPPKSFAPGLASSNAQLTSLANLSHHIQSAVATNVDMTKDDTWDFDCPGESGDLWSLTGLGTQALICSCFSSFLSSTRPFLQLSTLPVRRSTSTAWLVSTRPMESRAGSILNDSAWVSSHSLLY